MLKNKNMYEHFQPSHYLVLTFSHKIPKGYIQMYGCNIIHHKKSRRLSFGHLLYL